MVIIIVITTIGGAGQSRPKRDNLLMKYLAMDSNLLLFFLALIFLPNKFGIINKQLYSLLLCEIIKHLSPVARAHIQFHGKID